MNSEEYFFNICKMKGILLCWFEYKCVVFLWKKENVFSRQKFEFCAWIILIESKWILLFQKNSVYFWRVKKNTSRLPYQNIHGVECMRSTCSMKIFFYEFHVHLMSKDGKNDSQNNNLKWLRTLFTTSKATQRLLVLHFHPSLPSITSLAFIHYNVHIHVCMWIDTDKFNLSLHWVLEKLWQVFIWCATATLNTVSFSSIIASSSRGKVEAPLLNFVCVCVHVWFAWVLDYAYVVWLKKKRLNDDLMWGQKHAKIINFVMV